MCTNILFRTIFGHKKVAAFFLRHSHLQINVQLPVPCSNLYHFYMNQYFMFGRLLIQNSIEGLLQGLARNHLDELEITSEMYPLRYIQPVTPQAKGFC
jgi:hypothetical protein